MAAGAAIVLVVFLLYAGYDNFHAVTPGLVYRSAQLSGAEFSQYIARHGIRSVINLRGKDPNSDWYREETAVLKKMGVVHLDINLSASRILKPEEIDRLVAAIKKAPKPVLFHCQAGADRSGLAAAAWRLVGEGQPPAVAAEELSLRYGHFPYLWSETDAMDSSFWEYVAARSNGVLP